MLPHNDGFSLVTAAFIHHTQKGVLHKQALQLIQDTFHLVEVPFFQDNRRFVDLFMIY
jgi:hypothetical protein